MTFSYWLFGKVVRSEHQLPLIHQSPEGRAPDVVIRYSDETIELQSAKDKFVVTEHGVGTWTVQGHFGDRYLFSGNEIILPKNIASYRSLSVRIALSILPLYLTLKGEILLHAGAFRADGACHLIIGDSGAGKSTLAAYAKLRGADVLADDICRVSLSQGKITVHRSGTPLSLLPSSLDLLGCSGQANLGEEDEVPDFLDEKFFFCQRALSEPGAMYGVNSACFLASEKIIDRLRGKYIFDQYMKSIVAGAYMSGDEAIARRLKVFEALPDPRIINRHQEWHPLHTQLARKFEEILARH